MKFKDEKGFWDYYELNDDPYGRGTLNFAFQWAELMEYLIGEGYDLEEISEVAERVIDESYGITGFMYGCAVSTLAAFWIHGEQLRVWHNSKYSQFDETEDKGGTINPAILTIG